MARYPYAISTRFNASCKRHPRWPSLGSFCNWPRVICWSFLVLTNYSWTILIGNLSYFVEKIWVYFITNMPSFLFLADIQSYLSLQILLTDTLDMVAAINPTIEKHLKKIISITLKDFNWLSMEDRFDVINTKWKGYAINLSKILIYCLYVGQVDFSFRHVENQAQLAHRQVRKIHISTPLKTFHKI